MKKTTKLIAVILSVVTVLCSMSLVAFASDENDNFTSQQALEVVLAEVGLEEDDLDYLYIDHEEDFKLEKYPVWELKFGADSICYEYYVSTNTNEILTRYTSAELKGDILYLIITILYSFINDFFAEYKLFG